MAENEKEVAPLDEKFLDQLFYGLGSLCLLGELIYYNFILSYQCLF